MNKPVWFPFYVNDFLSSSKVKLMSNEERGGYVLLLCHEWNDPQCSLPDNDEAVRKLSELIGDLTLVKSCFIHKRGRLINERLYTEWQKTLVEVPMERSTAPKSAAIYESYRAAYRVRYGVDPVRNKSVNIGLCQVVDKLGADDAPAVAAFYVTHNSQWYITKGHPVNLLVADAEKLRTEWATNTQVTATQARQADGKAARGQVWNELIDEFKAKEGA